MGQDRKQKILQAAESIFCEKGYHLATVDEVAERAGVAKGTIFYNFGSKAALFESILRNDMDYLTAAVRGKLAGTESPLEQVASIIDLHVSALMENPGFIAIFSRELSRGLDEHVRETVRRAREEYVAFVAGLLDEAVRYGILHAMDTSMLASVFFDVALSACAYAMEHGEPARAPLRSAEVAAFLKAFILDGIAVRTAEKGD